LVPLSDQDIWKGDCGVPFYLSIMSIDIIELLEYLDF
jgi:hypothetical protein